MKKFAREHADMVQKELDIVKQMIMKGNLLTKDIFESYVR
tara:strand:- start:444 stop:563 length:120 start_codon:yes stop_codon:yes gene_type:complete